MVVEEVTQGQHDSESVPQADAILAQQTGHEDAASDQNITQCRLFEARGCKHMQVFLHLNRTIRLQHAAQLRNRLLLGSSVISRSNLISVTQIKR